MPQLNVVDAVYIPKPPMNGVPGISKYFCYRCSPASASNNAKLHGANIQTQTYKFRSLLAISWLHPIIKLAFLKIIRIHTFHT